MKPGPKRRESKICPACGIEKERAEFYKKGATISHKCKPCTLLYNRSRADRYAGKYRAYQNEWRSNRYAHDAKYRKKVARQKKAAYNKRREAINQARRNRWNTDPFNPARLYFRRKDVKLRTPPWVSKEALLAIYANCPKGHEVDHIVPLKGLIDGRSVSGLHVPWNLQYLSKSANRRKRNRISERDIEHLN